MGRAGGGGGGRSGGSRSSSRSSGSFRSSGGSSRAGRSSYHSRSSRSYGSSYSSHHHHHYHGGGRLYGSYSERWTFGDTLVFVFIMVCILYAIFSGMSTGSGTKSTIERTRIESGLSYDNNVVIEDEIGWIESKSKVGSGLREFWDKTGVQPYIIFLNYNENYNSDAERENQTELLYDKYIDREDAFLFVYYGELDVENDVGLFCYTLGKQAAAVLDGEALDIWFNNLDYNWYGSGTTTDVLINTYCKTAKTIMDKPTNGWDFGIVIALVIAGIAGMCFIVKLVKAKHKREKEKAQETQDILNASINNLSQGPVDDGLLDKYK